jgi:hypothetical protein
MALCVIKQLRSHTVFILIRGTVHRHRWNTTVKYGHGIRGQKRLMWWLLRPFAIREKRNIITNRKIHKDHVDTKGEDGWRGKGNLHSEEDKAYTGNRILSPAQVQGYLTLFILYILILDAPMNCKQLLTSVDPYGLHSATEEYDGVSKSFRTESSRVEINNRKHSLRSNAKGYGGKTH